VKINKIYNWGLEKLKKSGVTNYKNEIKWIFESEEISYNEFITNPQKNLDFRKLLRLIIKIFKRSKRYPLQYIIGEEEFLGLKFKVNKNVLIPRPETEILVQEAIKILNKNSKVLDIGCGSGAIGLTLKYYRSDLDITMSDISKKALKVAKENCNILLGNTSSVKFVYSNLFSKIDSKFDAILSNPPYITKEEKDIIDPELKYEPKLSLFCNYKIEFYEKILISALGHIKNKGLIIFELGFNTDKYLENVFKENEIIKKNYIIKRFTPDNYGMNRVCIIEYLK